MGTSHPRYESSFTNASNRSHALARFSSLAAYEKRTQESSPNAAPGTIARPLDSRSALQKSMEPVITFPSGVFLP